MAKLYMVGPVGGSWRDVPLRAVRILQASSLVVARDINLAREWLLQGDVDTPLVGIGDGEVSASLLATLRARDVAWLVMDLTDLDSLACCLLGLLIEQGIEVMSVPGPSSAISSLSVSGLPTDSFTLLGTLSGVSSERRALLAAVAGEARTVVCEVAADLMEAMQDVLACLGDRRVVLVGERDAWRGQASQVREWPGRERLVLIIEGAGQDRGWTQERVAAEVSRLLVTGASPRDIARDVAQRSGWSKRQVYQVAITLFREV